jgi:hypothetical protein
MMIVPPCLILENHDFYFNEYISRQKSYADSGVDIRDEDIPAIKYFNKVALSSFVAYLTLFTFTCIFMISGVAARKSQLIVPWLGVAFLTLLFFLIMSISAMFAIASVKSLIVLFLAGMPLGFGVYFWLTVYSTFAQFRGEKPPKWSGQQFDRKASIIPETALVEAEAEVTPVPEVAGPDRMWLPLYQQQKRKRLKSAALHKGPACQFPTLHLLFPMLSLWTLTKRRQP